MDDPWLLKKWEFEQLKFHDNWADFICWWRSCYSLCDSEKLLSSYWINLVVGLFSQLLEEASLNLHSVCQPLPNSSSMVLPPAVSLTPRTLLNRIEKALPHTPETHRKHTVRFKGESLVVAFGPVHENIFLTHQEMKRVLLIFLHNSSHEELASKHVWGHKGAILCHPNFIWTELHPVYRLKSQY